MSWSFQDKISRSFCDKSSRYDRAACRHIGRCNTIGIKHHDTIGIKRHNIFKKMFRVNCRDLTWQGNFWISIHIYKCPRLSPPSSYYRRSCGASHLYRAWSHQPLTIRLLRKSPTDMINIQRSARTRGDQKSSKYILFILVKTLKIIAYFCVFNFWEYKKQGKISLKNMI